MHQNAKCICRYKDDCLPAVTAQLVLSQCLFAPLKDMCGSCVVRRYESVSSHKLVQAA